MAYVLTTSSASDPRKAIIHLELVSDLTISSFLNALERFTSRRGMCCNIYSDNGSNFKEFYEVYELLTNFENETEINFFLD